MYVVFVIALEESFMKPHYKRKFQVTTLEECFKKPHKKKPHHMIHVFGNVKSCQVLYELIRHLSEHYLIGCEIYLLGYSAIH